MYLNNNTISPKESSFNLTLTRVVFEYNIYFIPCCFGINLTLTRVVFECCFVVTKEAPFLEFNFNKSCIWIFLYLVFKQINKQFNFNKSCIWIGHIHGNVRSGDNLTLTRVVFECFDICSVRKAIVI